MFVVALLLPASPGDRRRGRGLREGRRCIASTVRAELVRRHRLTPVLTDRTANLAGHRGRRVEPGAGVPEVGVLLTGFARKLGFYRVTRPRVRRHVCEMRTSVWVTNERDGLAGESTRCARRARGVLRVRRLCDGYAEMEMASSFGTRVEISSFFIGRDCFVTAYM